MTELEEKIYIWLCIPPSHTHASCGGDYCGVVNALWWSQLRRSLSFFLTPFFVFLFPLQPTASGNTGVLNSALLSTACSSGTTSLATLRWRARTWPCSLTTWFGSSLLTPTPTWPCRSSTRSASCWRASKRRRVSGPRGFVKGLEPPIVLHYYYFYMFCVAFMLTKWQKRAAWVVMMHV
jgi:hypothetical protein